MLDEAMCEDMHLKQFMDPALADQHQMIGKVQRVAKDQLLKMLEIVLLEKYHDSGDSSEAQVLNERLRSLMTPKGMDEKDLRFQQLKVIDSYLLNENGKATLKSAIDVVRPMYL